MTLCQTALYQILFERTNSRAVGSNYSQHKRMKSEENNTETWGERIYLQFSYA